MKDIKAIGLAMKELDAAMLEVFNAKQRELKAYDALKKLLDTAVYSKRDCLMKAQKEIATHVVKDWS